MLRQTREAADLALFALSYYNSGPPLSRDRKQYRCVHLFPRSRLCHQRIKDGIDGFTIFIPFWIISDRVIAAGAY